VLIYISSALWNYQLVITKPSRNGEVEIVTEMHKIGQNAVECAVMGKLMRKVIIHCQNWN